MNFDLGKSETSYVTEGEGQWWEGLFVCNFFVEDFICKEKKEKRFK